ncbi:hypothetical protein [Thermococcus sp. M39]|uniref:hypothetical protein n=1 Tax=Thermococcus sp. M39 TaxID=1638262 RepID=UPI001F0EC625|nr:hypothetical protein [Thermococcus sp. M39]
MRNTYSLQLRYCPEELQYVIYSDDIEELLADYAETHHISETFQKELERYVWQFLMFTKTGKIEKGREVKAPNRREEYVISREVLSRYVAALRDAEYSNSSLTKRLQAVIIVLRRIRSIGSADRCPERSPETSKYCKKNRAGGKHTNSNCQRCKRVLQEA